MNPIRDRIRESLSSHFRATSRAVKGIGMVCVAAAIAVAVWLWPGSAFSALSWPHELIDFSPDPVNPVFVSGGPGDWDAEIRERGWILFDAKALPGQPAWRLWYTGYDGSRSHIRRVGLATSNDGVRWVRFLANPLLRNHWVEDMTVVRNEGTLYMFAEGRRDQAQLLTSTDGVVWHPAGLLDIRQTDGRPITPGPYGTPTVWLESGVWHLFYERRDLGVWLATSTDLKLWRNVQDTPVLSPGPKDYDRDLIAMNQVVKYHGQYYAYYHGTKSGTRLWSTCVARSVDLIHWEKYPANPLLPISENKSSGILVHDGRGHRLYTMHTKVYLHRAR